MKKYPNSPAFDLGAIVYLKTDPDQLPRQILSYTTRCGGHITYNLACGVDETTHDEIEIDENKNPAGDK